MNDLTVSETLFIELCKLSEWTSERVSEAAKDGVRRPDFTLTLRSGTQLAVEIKQFDPNPEEEMQLNKTVRTFQTEPGDRIRKALGSGARQLKTLSEGIRPALLIVYDNVGTSLHTAPYAVLTAMRGLDTIDVSIPINPVISPLFGPPRPGPKKKMTAGANTTVSGIGVLRALPGGPHLEVYHNPHAKNELAPGQLSGSRVTHFEMKEDQSGWIEIATKE